MNWKKYIGSGVVVVLLVVCSHYFLDKGIALYVKRVLNDARLSHLSADIPDFLFAIVCATTGIAGTAYFYHVHKSIYNKTARFFLLIACAVPLSFFLKSILKFAVGRVTARFWLGHQGVREFNWFHGVGHYSGFPSGHMAVFSVLVIALWRFYPRYRPVYFGFLSVLALALLATDYHFLSDIIAGAYLGLLVYDFTLRGLTLLSDSAAGNEEIPNG